jgi:hypothetical protein
VWIQHRITREQLAGCCWAFSAVAAVEGIHQIKTGELVPLSEQQVLDCSADGNYGCNGGRMDSAFEYIGGIAAEDSYPYTASQNMCQSVEPAVAISGYEVPGYDEDALTVAVANQPLSSTPVACESLLVRRGGRLARMFLFFLFFLLAVSIIDLFR